MVQVSRVALDVGFLDVAAVFKTQTTVPMSHAPQIVSELRVRGPVRRVLVATPCPILTFVEWLGCNVFRETASPITALGCAMSVQVRRQRAAHQPHQPLAQPMFRPQHPPLLLRLLRVQSPLRLPRLVLASVFKILLSTAQAQTVAFQQPDRLAPLHVARASSVLEGRPILLFAAQRK